MLCGRDGIAFGGVHHDNSPFGRSINIDVVHADACTAYDFEFPACLDDILRDLCLAADNECIVITDLFYQ